MIQDPRRVCSRWKQPSNYSEPFNKCLWSAYCMPDTGLVKETHLSPSFVSSYSNGYRWTKDEIHNQCRQLSAKEENSKVRNRRLLGTWGSGGKDDLNRAIGSACAWSVPPGLQPGRTTCTCLQGTSSCGVLAAGVLGVACGHLC